MAKNYFIFDEICRWITQSGRPRVVICYDNEDKGTPGLPGYKQDRRDRHDAAIWARILEARLHAGLKIKTGVVMLPNEWRDANGKADWDGGLAKIGRAA